MYLKQTTEWHLDWVSHWVYETSRGCCFLREMCLFVMNREIIEIATQTEWRHTVGKNIFIVVHLYVCSVRHIFCLQRPHLNKKLIWGICIVFIGRDVLFFFFFGRFLYLIIYFLFIFTSFSLRIVFQIYLDFFLFNKCSENTAECLDKLSPFSMNWDANMLQQLQEGMQSTSQVASILGKLFTGKLTSIT